MDEGRLSKADLERAWYQARREKAGDAQPLPGRRYAVPFFNDEFTDVYTVLYAVSAPEYRWPDYSTSPGIKRTFSVCRDFSRLTWANEPSDVYVEISTRRLAALGIAPSLLFDAFGSGRTV
jgi:hypothetical protein